MNLNSQQFVLLKRPVGTPDESLFGLENVVLSTALKNNELLLHGLYYSVDPYMRGRMSDAKSYVAPYSLNRPIDGSVIARVVESKSKMFKPDDIVFGHLPWATEVVVSEGVVHKIDTKVAPASEYLGVLGMTGLTAYFGLVKIGKPSSGDTVVVSGAAGAVGSVVGQIAKLKGCRVVGIVGSDEKADMIRNQLGFDQAINYKDSVDLADNLKLACPNGVDIYFDNVGGEISDLVMQNMNFHGRVVICGQISLYNSKSQPVGPRLQPLLLTRSISMQGFIVGDFKDQFEEGTQALAKWLSEGKIKSTETIIEGFDLLPQALIGLFEGKNTGKMIVKASDIKVPPSGARSF